MQKFEAKFQNVPMDAPQVHSSTSTLLNRDQNLSEVSIVRTSNNLEVDLLQHKGEQGLRVPATAYVFNQRGRPLMPCSERKAHVLLQKGEAKVIRNYPFVIQLMKATGEQVQQCFLGIDSGYKYVGFSAITDKKEIVCGTFTLDGKTSERLTERRMHRKNRRNRLWYRKPRFNNRMRKVGWLPPSIQRKFNTHITLINILKKLLPTERVTIEVGNFDIQRIENPDIKGIQYQQGSLFEHQNMRSFLMAREHGKCQLCGKEFSKTNPSHIHHIIPRNKGGTDREKNLALLHKKCHDKLHKKSLYNSLKKNKQYKEATFMSIIRNKFRETIVGCRIVFGNETFVKRQQLRLEKSHSNDAFVIAGGTTQIKTIPNDMGQKHKNNRSLQTVRRRLGICVRRKRYSIQPFDLVTVDNLKYVSRGCSNRGKIVLCSRNNIDYKIYIKRVEDVFHTKSIYNII